MAVPGPDGEDPFTPLAAFNFHVHFSKHPDPGGQADATAAFGPMSGIATAITGGFSEISGLEATMEPKAIKAGGHNYGAIQRAGPVTFGTVIMKRGIIPQRHLWSWWSIFAGADGAVNGGWGAGSRCDVYVVMLKLGQPLLGWRLDNAMPVKFRVGDLNAKGGEVAVEELHLVHEGLNMAPLP